MHDINRKLWKKDYTVVKNQSLSLTVWLPRRVASIIQQPSTGRIDAKHCCGGNLAGLAAQETCIDGAETNFASRKQANASAGKIVLFAHTFFFQKKCFPV